MFPRVQWVKGILQNPSVPIYYPFCTETHQSGKCKVAAAKMELLLLLLTENLPLYPSRA